jgi:hypothetical protein
LTKEKAESLGWDFTAETGGRYVAVKRVGETLLAKEHPTLEQLLNDIDDWESRQTAVAAARKLFTQQQRDAVSRSAKA